MTDSPATGVPAIGTPAVGSPAPDFTLPTDGGGSVTLSAQHGSLVVVYFYPKDDTPGCTKEACGFGEALPDFSILGATVIGISKDSVASHEKFKAKYHLPFILASDKDSDVTERYGCWVEKSMYGRTYMGIDRATFLIDGEGIVRGVWQKVKVPGHVEAVLAAARAL
jgi:thioredoxin-dependent peroxiredoxin